MTLENDVRCQAEGIRPNNNPTIRHSRDIYMQTRSYRQLVRVSAAASSATPAGKVQTLLLEGYYAHNYRYEGVRAFKSAPQLKVAPVRSASRFAMELIMPVLHFRFLSQLAATSSAVLPSPQEPFSWPLPAGLQETSSKIGGTSGPARWVF